MLDAAALTVRRTAAVSLVALRRLAAARADRLLLFGSGPQARAHLEAVAAEWPLAWVGVVSRDTSNADRFATRARTAYPEVRVEVVGAGRVADAVARAGIVVCATTSTAPVFEDGALVDESCVVAVGSHRPDAREVPSSLVGRSYVVVEERATALREAGDVIVALDEGHLEAGDVVELGELVRGAAGEPGPGPRVFKSVGMAWEDAVVSALMVERSVR
jgi:ornithine cyclodeaminase